MMGRIAVLLGGGLLAGFLVWVIQNKEAMPPKVEIPAVPEITAWSGHLKGFSVVAAPMPGEAFVYRSSKACPLRYGFAFEQRIQTLPRGQTQAQTQIGRIVGVLSAVEAPGGMRLSVLQLGRAGAIPAGELNAMVQAGPIALANEKGLSWRLTGAAHPLWDGRQGSFFLSRFWPELSPKPQGHARKISRKIGKGSLLATSETRHYLRIQGELLAYLVGTMKVQQRGVDLEHRSEYVMMSRGHLLYAHFSHRDQTQGAKVQTTTRVKGELRLIAACHGLRLPPFVHGPPPKRP